MTALVFFAVCVFLSTPSARRATVLLDSEIYNAVISIHALREEGDGRVPGIMGNVDLFLSTPSARRATRRAAHVKAGVGISIHALREEGDDNYNMF